MITYFHGQWVDDAKATVSVRSRALNYGLGCFGGIRGYKATAGDQVHLFRLDRHVARLAISAKILHLRMPEAAEAARIMVELVRRNDMRDDVYLRPLLIHDSDKLAPILDPETSKFIVWLMPLGNYLGKDAIDVCVSSWRRVPDNAIPARAKPTGIYLNSALARREALDNGFDEAIFTTEGGKVSEGSAEHVFIVRDGVLYSPPGTEDNLDGITRASLIELATEDLGLTFVERPIGRTELYAADEMFLCGTGAQVTPVRSVDRRPVGTSDVGPVTQRIKDHFFAVVRGEVAERKTWLTPVWE